MTFFIKYSASNTHGCWIVQATEMNLGASKNPDYK